MQMRRYFPTRCFAQRVRSSSKKPHDTKRSTMKDSRFRGLKLKDYNWDGTCLSGEKFERRWNSDQKLILFYE